MAFSEFTLESALSRLGLGQRLAVLFPELAPVTPSDDILTRLREYEATALFVDSEFARNIFFIAPVLLEARRLAGAGVRLLPVITLDVDRDRGLNGFCDYLIARSQESFTLTGPLMAVVGAKREDIGAGLGQCVASMVAIRLFNKMSGSAVPAVYGCVTSGTNWRFLMIQGGLVTINRHEHLLSELGLILSILVHIARDA